MIKQTVKNPRYPHQVVITRVCSEDNFSDEVEETVIYDGVCHVFDQRMLQGEVISSGRKISVPVRFDEWEVVPQVNDNLLVTMGAMVERAVVNDVVPGNGRTEISYRLKRND